jgi:hypothetical protein
MYIVPGYSLMAQETETSNKLFEIISVNRDTVKFKTLQSTKIYNVSLVSETGTSLDAASISNEYGDIVMASGATAWPGSKLPMPKKGKMGAFSLPADAVIRVFEFNAPDNFVIKKILFETEKGKASIAIAAFAAQSPVQSPKPDIIMKKNGDEIMARVTEVGITEVKYKRFENENGPTYTLLKSEIFMITYENGGKDVFRETEEQPKDSREKEVAETRSGELTGTNRKGYIGISVGPAIPVGNIGDAEFGTGALVGINFGILLSENTGITASIFGTSHSNSLDEDFSIGFSSFLVGPLFSFPVSSGKKAEFDLKPVIGFAQANVNTGNTQFDIDSRFAFGIGAAFRFNLSHRFALSASFDYIHAAWDKKKFYIGTEGADLSVIGISIGANCRF